MERPLKGDIVVIPFPFSDLTAIKKRPALVLAVLDRDDIILCQITSRFRLDSRAIELKANDFASGSLPAISYVRCGKLFTANVSIIERKAGSLKVDIVAEIAERNALILTDL
jgi:mRNA interferase MazF